MSAKKRQTIIKYFATLSTKYHVPNILVCIEESLREGKSDCNGLTIICRNNTDDSAVFLFIKDEEVVAQFPIPKRILRRSNESLLNYYIQEIEKKAD